ncbi:MAG: class I SAM-dependent methyltransferase [bacterium]|nr:class I SAM-dependent methyltransferase [bacterium]
MSHYFTQNPTSMHTVKVIEETLRGKHLRFITDAGVFSKSGVDFGSRLLIETMQILKDARVLDIGCGWGPIGISAALINPTGKVVLADINTRALELANKNIALNKVANATTCQSDLYLGVGNELFDVILSNPPIRAGKDIVFSIFTGAKDHLRQAGSLWVVIQKKQGAPSAEKKLREIFPTVIIREKSKGYFVFEAINT